MLDKYLIKHCSPTLASLKIANLFTYKYICKNDFNNQIKHLNTILNNKGIKLFILKDVNNTALIYVYRGNLLQNKFNEKQTQDFLLNYGYEHFNVSNVLEILKIRINKSENFPHEIGIFLGYPLEDVKGFILNKGKNCICAGCWKVYCNECEANKMFSKYKKCTDLYVRLWNEGKSILQLTVAI